MVAVTKTVSKQEKVPTPHTLEIKHERNYLETSKRRNETGRQEGTIQRLSRVEMKHESNYLETSKSRNETGRDYSETSSASQYSDSTFTRCCV